MQYVKITLAYFKKRNGTLLLVLWFYSWLLA